MSSLNFSWKLIPGHVRVDLVHALTGDQLKPAGALKYLEVTWPAPSEAMLDGAPDAGNVLRDWLGEDQLALDFVYGLLIERMPTVRKSVTWKKKWQRVRGLPLTVEIRRALVGALEVAGTPQGTVGGAAFEPRNYQAIPTVAPIEAPLFQYQEEAVAALDQAWRQRRERLNGLLVMPTGSGKTHTAVSWLLRTVVPGGTKVLWLTHRQELMRQTARAFVRAASQLKGHKHELRIRLIGGGYDPGTNVADPAYDVGIASIAALSQPNAMKAVERYLQDHNVVLVFDEAHHATAPTWRKLLELARDVTSDAVVGLTATPTRASADERRLLQSLFATTLHEVELVPLVNQRFLATPRPQVVSTEITADEDIEPSDLMHFSRFRELSTRLANQLAENVPRNRVIVDTWLEGPGGDGANTFGKTIVFAVNRWHGRHLTQKFQEAGVAAAFVEHQTPPDERTSILEGFRSGELAVLVNVELLTEGVDLPDVQSVFLTRPTNSEVLLSQMVGRAMRGPAVGGTADAYLVSFRDHWERFPDWADPFRFVGGLTPDGSEGAIESGTVAEPRPGLSREDLLTLISAAAAELEGSIHVVFSSAFAAVPVGWFDFDVEVPIEDDPDGNVEDQQARFLVYEHQRPGYAAIEAEVRDGGLLGEEVALERFFASLPSPRPSTTSLLDLANYIRQHSEMPTFHPLENRDQLDPARVALSIIQQDLRPSEARELVDTVVADSGGLVERYFGDGNRFREAVLAEVARVEAGRPRPWEENRVPYVPPGDLDHVEFGVGRFDLHAAVERVLADPVLFPDGAPPAPAGTRWAENPIAAAWAFFDPLTDEIVVSPVVDSLDAPAEVLDFLVFHELLHHEDYLAGRPSHHGPEFRRREARHPSLVAANVWLDTWHDRFTAGWGISYESVAGLRTSSAPGALPDAVQARALLERIRKADSRRRLRAVAAVAARSDDGSFTATDVPGVDLASLARTLARAADVSGIDNPLTRLPGAAGRQPSRSYRMEPSFARHVLAAVS